MFCCFKIFFTFCFISGYGNSDIIRTLRYVPIKKSYFSWNNRGCSLKYFSKCLCNKGQIYTRDPPGWEKQQVNATQTVLANIWLHCVCLVAVLKNILFCFQCQLLFQQSTWAARLFLRHIGDKCIMRNQIMQLRANLEDKAVYLIPFGCRFCFCGIWNLSI